MQKVLDAKSVSCRVQWDKETLLCPGSRADIDQTISPASADYQATRVVILVPTRELALQVNGFLKSLTAYCEGLVQIVNTATSGASVQRSVHGGNLCTQIC